MLCKDALEEAQGSVGELDRLVRAALERHAVEHLVGELEEVVVAVGAQDGPGRFRATALDKQGMQKEKAVKGQGALGRDALGDLVRHHLLDRRELLGCQRRVEAVQLKGLELLVVEQVVLM